MNKPLLPIITLKPIVADEKRIKAAYFRVFEIARRNILARRGLTNPMSLKYTKVQYGKSISNNRGGIQDAQGE